MQNNRCKKSYEHLFTKIKTIITIENTKNISLLTYSTDFEVSLIESLKEVFPEQRRVDCYFHYCKNVYAKAKKLHILEKEENSDGKILLKNLYQIPFIINDLQEDVNNIVVYKFKPYLYKF